ncbi:hypothetical protein [Streptomyces sp. JJ36]|uniref:hypothetical protein n=1 Tax=Streptomyces sp. JJ36 TaxID=2736645 RepID=UPI001F16BF1D|nr:hypothetical protein [Streptomyces sp. JJ36]MCF6524253.1 hypothetical protein [Streptomyces sp. JJ36]
MTAPPSPRPGAAPPAPGPPVERTWDDPLTRLFLLLEIAREPEWLREAAAAHAVRPAEGGGAG